MYYFSDFVEAGNPFKNHMGCTAPCKFRKYAFEKIYSAIANNGTNPQEYYSIIIWYAFRALERSLS